MSDSLFNDSALRTAKAALNGLSLRQELISRNLANVDTPGYRAQQIDFENVLKRAIKGDNQLPMAVSHTGHLASAVKQSMNFQVSQRPGGAFRADENNVDVDTELLEMSQTGIQYQAVSQSITKKMALLKSIAMSR